MNLREWALPFYTILVQLATGALLTLWIIRYFAARKYGREHVDRIVDNSILIIFLTISAGMLGAHFHLSKPYLSFLAIMNLRHSWLSREILFNLLFFLSTGALLYLQFRVQNRWQLKTALGWLAIAFGFANVYCMGRIYLLPTQVAWNTSLTMLSFMNTALLLGMMALISLQIMDLKYSELRKLPKAQVQAQIIQISLPWFAVAATFLTVVIVTQYVYQFFLLNNDAFPTAQTSLLLLVRLYPILFGMRLAVIFLGVIGLAVAAYWQGQKKRPVSDLLVPTYITCLLVMIGEILGRFLFYATHVRTGI
jgi:anaerobic dimethyl sulfoxide reductase subunit C (anchor subunit)